MNSATVRTLLVRGMLAGLAAGLLATLVAYFLGESSVDAGIAYEDAHSTEHGMEVVSRGMQSTSGLATGILVYGVALGGIAALVFCFALGRIGRFSPRTAAALVSAGALIALYVVPFLKYPANPPAVSDADTISRRTTLYLLMMLLSALLAIGTAMLGKRLAPRLGNWYATVAAGAFFVVAVGLAYAFVPAVNEMPKDYPANVVWEFRIAALAIQTTLWTGFGLIFGELAQRLLAPRPAAAAPPQATPVPN